MRDSMRCDLLDVARGLESGSMDLESAVAALRSIAGVEPDKVLHLVTVEESWAKRLRGVLTRPGWRVGAGRDWLVPVGEDILWVTDECVVSSVATVADVPSPSANKPEQCSEKVLYEVVANGYFGLGWRFRTMPPEWAVYTPRLGFHMRTDDTVVPIRPSAVVDG